MRQPAGVSAPTSRDSWRLSSTPIHAPAAPPTPTLAHTPAATPSKQITNELLDVLAAQARDGGGTAEVEVAEAAMRTTLDLIGEVGYG